MESQTRGGGMYGWFSFTAAPGTSMYSTMSLSSFILPSTNTSPPSVNSRGRFAVCLRRGRASSLHQLRDTSVRMEDTVTHRVGEVDEEAPSGILDVVKPVLGLGEDAHEA